jgi:hypothetical protein
LYSIVEHRNLSDSFEWAYQTALTIGYGDVPPATVLGRLMTAVFGHFWIWSIVPFIIVNVNSRVQHDRNQYTHREQEWTALALQHIATALGVTLPPQPSDTDLGDLTAAGELVE